VTSGAGVEHHKYSISGNFDEPAWSVIGCEPTNQTICGSCAFVYFEVFVGVKPESVKAQLKWFGGCNINDGCTAATAGR